MALRTRRQVGCGVRPPDMMSAMSPAIPSVYSQTLRLIMEGVVMPRTRVHNMNISLDGYAAGEHVTFDAPIGGAERLFKWFDGRVIHGVDKVDAPLTLDRALTSMTFPTGRASGSWTGRRTRCFAWLRRLRVVAMSASAEDLRPCASSSRPTWSTSCTW